MSHKNLTQERNAMQVIDSKEIKGVKKAREIVDAQQRRIWQLELALDDLARACEIAQYSQQYNLTETFREAANALLEDRLTVPEQEQTPLKVQIITGEINDDVNRQIQEKAKTAAGVND
jgi:hypothetical protein